jgi:hypothetical protein
MTGSLAGEGVGAALLLWPAPLMAAAASAVAEGGPGDELAGAGVSALPVAGGPTTAGAGDDAMVVIVLELPAAAAAAAVLAPALALKGF